MARSGLTNIQIQVHLHFDDGVTVTLATPVWRRDIREGEFFDEGATQEIMVGAGRDLAEMIGQEGLNRIHNRAVVNSDKRRWPKSFEDPDGPFSMN